jgi:hypothetical protein
VLDRLNAEQTGDPNQCTASRRSSNGRHSPWCLCSRRVLSGGTGQLPWSAKCQDICLGHWGATNIEGRDVGAYRAKLSSSFSVSDSRERQGEAICERSQLNYFQRSSASLCRC